MSDAGNGVTRCDYCGSCCGCDADCPAPSNILMDDSQKLTAMYRRFEADQGRIEELRAKVLEVGTENARLRAALQKAVDLYGKPGGPWNVPDETGTWIAMAKEALGQ